MGQVMHVVVPPIIFDAVGFVAAFAFLVLLAALYAVPSVLIARFGLGHHKPVNGKRAAEWPVPRYRHN